MSIDKTIQIMIRDEVKMLLAPLMVELRAIRLIARSGRGKAARANSKQQKRGCAIQGCRRPARSKGYCSAHYQKFRALLNEGRLPKGWVENAAAQSVRNVKLPRGRTPVSGKR
jgi:hypothetical protein